MMLQLRACGQEREGKKNTKCKKKNVIKLNENFQNG